MWDSLSQTGRLHSAQRAGSPSCWIFCRSAADPSALPARRGGGGFSTRAGQQLCYFHGNGTTADPSALPAGGGGAISMGMGQQLTLPYYLPGEREGGAISTGVGQQLTLPHYLLGGGGGGYFHGSGTTPDPYALPAWGGGRAGLF